MKYTFTILLLLGITFSQVVGQNNKQKAKTFLYFHGGQIVAAEIKTEPANIINVNKYEPPSEATSNVAWATVVAKLDKGRSLSIYDYALKNKQKNKVFTCIAIREMNLPFDASKWQIAKTDPKKIYSMLFKVEMPRLGKPEFILHYKLGKAKDILLQLQSVDNDFTPAKLIPPKGMYGVAPPKSTQKNAKTTQINPENNKTNAKTNTGKTSATSIMNAMTKGKNNTKKTTASKKVNFLKGTKGKHYSASSEGGPTTTIAQAVDGKPESEWHTFVKNQKHWVRFVIPEGKKEVSKVVIKWGDSYPKEFKLITKPKNDRQTKFTIIKYEKNNKGGTATIPVNKEAVVIKNARHG